MTSFGCPPQRAIPLKLLITASQVCTLGKGIKRDIIFGMDDKSQSMFVSTSYYHPCYSGIINIQQQLLPYTIAEHSPIETKTPQRLLLLLTLFNFCGLCGLIILMTPKQHCELYQQSKEIVNLNILYLSSLIQNQSTGFHITMKY